MTWYYDIADDNSQMDIYDQTGTLVTTVDNDGSGFRIPGDVLEIMRQEYLTEVTPDSAPVHSQRAVGIVADVFTQDIEAGTPP